MNQTNPENPLLATVAHRLGWFVRNPLKGFSFIVVLGALVWWFTGDNDTTLARPLIANVDIGDIENAVTAAGNLQPYDYVDVGAQVSGQLEKLAVEVGDKVSAGTLLAEIDATVQLNRVEASRASLRALEAQLSARGASLKLATANADRQTRLIEEDATSQADFDSAISTLASAQSSLIQLQSQIAQSNASLASDEATLSYSSITAPVTGTVISINMKEGQTLNASQQTPTILRIADLSTMTVQAEVSEADVSKLTTGMEVYFTTLGGGERRWYGKLRQVLPKPAVTNNVVLYTALFDVDNADGTLLSDMTAQIFFVTSSARNVVRVPVGALDFNDANNLLGLATTDTETPSPTLNNETAMDERERRIEQAFSERPELSNRSPEELAELRERLTARGGIGGSGGGMGNGGGRTRGEDDARSGESRASNDGNRPTTSTVLLVNPDGNIERRTITIGVSSRISAEIISGLEPGDQVVAGIIQASTAPAANAGGLNISGGGLGGGGGRGRGF